VKAGREFRFVTRDEIRVAADVSEEEGALEPEEGEMLDSVLELSVARVSEVMVPRVDIVALEENDLLDRVLQVVIESGYSRIPIYQATLDSITGILYVNDLLSVLSSGASEIDLKAIARAPVYVPESKLLDELLAEMRDRAVHLAIVVDEFGGTEGLVSIEDILEELVGEIEDEHDTVTEDMVLLGPDEAVVGAKERIEEVNDQLVVNLPNDQYDTVGGLITGLANRIPQIGEVYETDGVALTVEEGDDRNIERVRITVTHRDGGES
jgi:magnesium and cobalt transporter